MKEQLIIIGAGGHGKVLADMASKMMRWKEIAFLDDNASIEKALNFPVIGDTREIHKYIQNAEFIIGIGNNDMRKEIQSHLEASGFCIATLVHPSAILGSDVHIGIGTVIMAGVVINCCTKIGKGCIINTSATLDHDANIGDYVHISPGVKIAGSVNIGNNCWLCIGGSIGNNISITNDCIIGAGSVVIKDITEVGTYFGVPSRRQ